MDKSGKQILKTLSYVIWPVGLVTFLIAEEDKDMKFHGAQGLAFGLTFNIIWYLLFGLMPWILYPLVYISHLLGIFWLVLTIIYAVKAYKGERFRIPVIYDIMRKFYKEEEIKEEAQVVGKEE